MQKTIEMAGRVYGNWKVLHQYPRGNIKGDTRWVCECSCGKQKILRGHTLRSAQTKSCGCQKGVLISKAKFGKIFKPETHTPQYKLWQNAKRRAQKSGAEFNITPEDIYIPTHCPILGMQLEFGSANKGNSPSLDRLDNNKGYTKTNINVISYRANALKNNASLEELAAIVNWIQTRLSA